MQAPLQSTVPAWQLSRQVPSWQGAARLAAPQSAGSAPQWSSSVAGSMQAPSHAAIPSLHERPQTPPLQTGPRARGRR